ncbi:FAD:protein FMN transferase, partial [Lactobacillus nasalidis]
AMTIPFTISLASRQQPAASLKQAFARACRQIQQELKRLESDYSAFLPDSLVSRFAQGEERILLASPEFQQVYAAALLAREETDGAFDPYFAGKFDPTGLVKGWAIQKCFASLLLPLASFPEVAGLCINGGGDLHAWTRDGFRWKVGIEDPKQPDQLLAIYDLASQACASSGFAHRGQHVTLSGPADLSQVTVLAPSLTFADIWATAGLAMGETAFKRQIAAKRLSGLYAAKDGRLVLFKEGELHYVQKA